MRISNYNEEGLTYLLELICTKIEGELTRVFDPGHLIGLENSFIFSTFPPMFVIPVNHRKPESNQSYQRRDGSVVVAKVV